MRLVAAVLILCGLGTGAAQAQQAPQDCALKQYGAVDMHVVDDKVFIPATVAGTQRDLLFSIAGSYNHISQDLAEQLNLRAHPLERRLPINSKVHYTRAAVVPELVLGNVKLKDVEFLVVPRDQAAGGPPEDISLGVFGAVDLELDMAAHKLKFFSQDHCPGKVVYWTQAFTQVPIEIQEFGYIRPKMMLDGKPVTVALELNDASSMMMGDAGKLFGLNETSPGMTQASTRPDGVNVYRYPFKSLGTEDLKIANPAISVVEQRGKDCGGLRRVEFPDPTHGQTSETQQLGACYGGAGLSLGYSVLSKLHLYFSIKEKLMYISGAGAK
jgi:hypothetical protein